MLLSLIESESGLTPESQAVITAAAQALNSLPQSGTFLEYGVHFVSQDVLDKIAGSLGISIGAMNNLLLDSNIVLIRNDIPIDEKMAAFIQQADRAIFSFISTTEQALIDVAVAALTPTDMETLRALTSSPAKDADESSEEYNVRILNAAIAQRDAMQYLQEKGHEQGQVLLDLNTILDKEAINPLQLRIKSLRGLRELGFRRLNGENIFMPICGTEPSSHGTTSIIDLFNMETGRSYTIRELREGSDKQIEVMKWLSQRVGMPIIYPFMDLNIEPQAIATANGKGSVIEYDGTGEPLRALPFVKLSDIDSGLAQPDPAQDMLMAQQIQFINQARADEQLCDKGIVGWVQGPLSILVSILGIEEAIYLITDPGRFEKWLDYADGVVKAYAQALVEAGADSICILEPTATTFLHPDRFGSIMVERINAIIAEINSIGAPVIYHACKDTTLHFGQFARINAQGFSLDKEVSLSDFALLRPDAVLLGNVDNVNMFTKDPATIYNESLEMIEKVEEVERNGLYIPATGCEILTLDNERGMEQLQAFAQGFVPDHYDIYMLASQDMNARIRALRSLRARYSEWRIDKFMEMAKKGPITPKELIDLLDAEPGGTPESDAIIAAAAHVLNNLPQSGTFLEYGVHFVSQDVLDKIADALPSLVTSSNPRGIAMKSGITLISDFVGEPRAGAETEYFVMKYGKAWANASPEEKNAWRGDMRQATFIHEIDHQILDTILKNNPELIKMALLAQLVTRVNGTFLISVTDKNDLIALLKDSQELKSLNEEIARFDQLKFLRDLLDDGVKAAFDASTELGDDWLRLKLVLDIRQITRTIIREGKPQEITGLFSADDNIFALMDEVDKISFENGLITPGLLEAIADVDELGPRIFTLMQKVIYGITTASRKEAGEALYKIFQSNPQINIEPLIKYMMEQAPTLGRRMEILRHINNLTLQQLATNIGGYEQMIQKWEADISMPTAVDLKKFALYFGIELVLIEFIKHETNSIAKTRLEDALKAIDVTQLPAYPIFVAGDAFFLNFESPTHIGENYVVAGEVIIFNLEPREGAFKKIEGDVAADGTITSLRVKIGTEPLQEVAINVIPLQTKITINGADYLAYVNSNGVTHLYGYRNINPDLAEALVRSFFEIKKQEDAASGTTYINDLLAAASYGDQAAMKNELANLARLIYATYLLDNTLSTLYSHHLNIVEIKGFFEDLTNFINSIQNTSCNPVLQGFTVFSTLP
jgi:uroporphyrinogen-III decarboxylase/transcriptional regulator with XRE-family HTH domain